MPRKAGGGVTLEGDKELLKKLKKLEAKVAKKIARKALRAGAKIVAPQVEQDAPVDQNWAIPEAVKIKSGKRSRKNISVNVVIGEGNFQGDTFYAAFVEFGTRFQPPQSYMQKAAEKKADEAGKAIATELKKGIEKAAKK